MLSQTCPLPVCLLLVKPQTLHKMQADLRIQVWLGCLGCAPLSKASETNTGQASCWRQAMWLLPQNICRSPLLIQHLTCSRQDSFFCVRVKLIPNHNNGWQKDFISQFDALCDSAGDDTSSALISYEVTILLRDSLLHQDGIVDVFSRWSEVHLAHGTFVDTVWREAVTSLTELLCAAFFLDGVEGCDTLP